MSKTVLALYDDFDVANEAVEALVADGFDRNDISIVANNAGDRYTGAEDVNTNDVNAGEGAGFGAVVGGLVGLGVALIPGIGPVLAAGPLGAAIAAGIGAVTGATTGGIVAGLVDFGVPETDAQYYAEGIRRGGALVSIDLLDNDNRTGRAQDILNGFNPVNIDQRASHYQESGWTGFDENATPYNENQISEFRSTVRDVPTGEKAHLDVVEEDLHVGKREVEDGRIRVATRVTERPVQEDVTLREERVVVERHPVDRPASSADLNNTQDATIELTESHEEAVVNKSARVVEEVVVGTEATEHTETIHDTIRRKDVEVDGALGGRSYADYQSRWRSSFDKNYAYDGTWEEYDPAYRFGYDLANNPSYSSYNWDRLEMDARTQWESDRPNTWDRFKAAIREAWHDVTGRG